MSAADDERRNREVIARLGVMLQDVFVGVAEAAQASITDGSPLTGAPGQPVDTGFLKSSWNLSFPNADTALIASNAAYAEAVEDGVGPHGPRAYGRKNGVGGSHSVKLTVASLDRIRDDVTRRVMRSGQ